MADSSAIDQALITKLASDGALLAEAVNGVFWDEAPPNSTRFVIVSMVASFDEAVFGGRAIEEVTYLVEARMLSTAGGNIRTAAQRIDELLDDQPMTVAGYTHMTTHRTERVRGTEVDESNTDVRWLRRGGHYVVQCSL